MATYDPVDKSLPLKQRIVIINDVEEGDQLILKNILGQPARKIRFISDNESDSITYKLNHHKELRKVKNQHWSIPDTIFAWGVYPKDAEFIDFWNANGQEVTQVGKEWETPVGLEISSIEIVDITGATSITLIAS